jgi:methyl-accepting chemotaxis protein
LFQFSKKHFGIRLAQEQEELAAKFAAVERSQAIVEFSVDGTILAANKVFLTTMGYQLDEVQGRHHSIFVDQTERDHQEYRFFWDRLRRGEVQSSEFRRIAKGGREVWVQASYIPLLDKTGQPYKILKFAADVTRQKLQSIDFSSQIIAINKSQATIEFKPDGTILTANENFLSTFNYRLDEIRGRHHSMFLEPSDASNTDYRAFWEKLKRGEFVSGEFKRIGRNGEQVWIQASYNPIIDASGDVTKVIKFATEVTASKATAVDYAGQIAAISRSQAVIEFSLDGTILNANENFVAAIGYSLAEIKGKHHSMFVPADERGGKEYSEFWARLKSGEYFAAEFLRIAKGGREVWIQASYNPILDLSGKPYKVVKYASDITHAKMRSTDDGGQIAAIRRAQAFIAFKPDGTVLDANSNFLTVMGYKLEEVVGSNHNMFVEAAYRVSREYKEHWAKLQRGEFVAGTFKRVGKSGNDVWIQGSYNPIVDGKGRVIKIVKIASDMTANIELATAIESAVNVMASAATELNSSSSSMTAISSEGTSKTNTVAAATEELSASIAEIARQLGITQDNTHRAKGQADQTMITVDGLASTVAKISEVVGLISSIAQQTNLLALNATIEAARAGEAGRGFAVVASEVKALAMQTANATGDITDQIKGIQSATSQVVDANKAIAATIVSINETSTAVAAAVEEQSAATREVAENIAEVAVAAAETGRITNDVGGAASEIAKQSEMLRRQVETFLYRLGVAR